MAEFGQSVLERDTGDDGLCRFHVLPGRWHWAVTKANYHLATGMLVVSKSIDNRVNCAIVPVLDCERLSGEVISAATGRPIDRARVSAWPKDIGVPADGESHLGPYLDAVSTDKDGRFNLCTPRDAAVRLIVRHGEHASGPDVLVEPGTSWIRVALAPAGRITVLRRSLVPEPASSGPSRCLLVGRNRVRAIPWDGDPPITIPSVPPGEYNVFFLTAEGGYGQTSVTVESGKHTEVIVDTVPGSQFEGQVVEVSGLPCSGAKVVVRCSDWPEEVSAWLGTGTTGASGRFRLFGGLLVQGILEVKDERKVMVREEAMAGRPIRIVMP